MKLDRMIQLLGKEIGIDKANIMLMLLGEQNLKMFETPG